MPHSDDFGIDDDDEVFLQAVTQIEASRHAGPRPGASPPPRKRRRTDTGDRYADGLPADGVDGSGSDAEQWNGDPGNGALKSTERPLQTQTQQFSRSDDGPVDDPDYYFPGELDQENNARQSRYKIHVPKNAQPLEDRYFTQTQAGIDDSPGAIRGPVWKLPPRPPPAPPVFRNPATRAPSISTSTSASEWSLKPVVKSFPGSLRDTNGACETDRPVVEGDGKANLPSHQAAGNRNSARATASVPPDLRMSFDIAKELANLPPDAFLTSSPEASPAKTLSFHTTQSVASQAQKSSIRGTQTGLKQTTLWGGAFTQETIASQAPTKKHAWPVKARDEPPTHHKLDDSAMKTWIYPTNLGNVRDYQYNIVARSLFHNTLVALPTGLGKTFIAATVMLNYYRWTKDAQIVFMAPTKPLIAQQMEACYQIVGIPRHDTVLMTGETTPHVRADEWLEKRVFFMTPQTVINDLKTGICDPKRLVCIVVDEAHKATGGYAYTEVISFVRRFNSSFRVLALTATPGSTVEAVQTVVDSLGIARVELRTEQSLDIRPYTHEKLTDTEVFDYSEEQSLVMGLLTKAVQPVLDKLTQQNAYWTRDPMKLHNYTLQQGRAKWMASDAGRKASAPVKGMVNSIFTVLSQLGPGINLLKNHGIGPFYGNALQFQRNVESGQAKGKYQKQIVEHEDWVKMMAFIRTWTNNPDFIGHPKLQYLREVVLNHFLDTGEGRQGADVPPAATRVMVFSGFRDSTEEICRVLKRNEPMLRPHIFVGQAASKDSEGMNQKRQNEVIQQFKSGKFNTLVATSIGEEGLDIGDVDLIVCYDMSASPIRMLQRIGRTGRKRAGRVVLLLMRGKEEDDYAKAQENYSFIQRTIADASRYNYHDEQSPRIIPKDVNPLVDKRIIDIPPENSQPVDLNERSRRGKGKAGRKRPPKKFHMPDGVRTGFTKASKLHDSDDSEGDHRATTSRRRRSSDTGKARKAALEREAPDIVPLPFLSDVLLNEQQQRDLTRNYASTTVEDGTLVVTAPDVDQCPTALQQLNQVKYVPHGRATTAVCKAIQKIQKVDNDWVEHMESILRLRDPQHDSESNQGLIAADKDEPADEEPGLPCVPQPPIPRAKASRRPRKPPVTAVKKPRRRGGETPARLAIQLGGSSAVEGDESEPESTPANMRIGTQGIDLGSHDTSGEDESDEADSELADFVVWSDQPIETVSSSLPGTAEVLRKRRGLQRKGNVNMTISSDDEVDDKPAPASNAVVSVESGGPESDVEPSKPERQRQLRKRKVVAESEDESDK